MNNKYYTYAYLREDRTPYYIGKGSNNRIYSNNGRLCNKPKDKSRIIFLKQNLTEEEAFKHEIYMIAVFGRKDLGTGILYNRTSGGEGCSGNIASEETRRKRSVGNIGKKNSKGYKWSYEQRERLKKSTKGKCKTEEHKKSLREAWKRRKKEKPITEETREKLRKTSSRNYLLTFNNGKEIIVNNLTKWCIENNYLLDGLKMVKSGRRNRHKDIVAVKRLDTTP